MSTHVNSPTLITEFLQARLAFHVVAAFCFLDEKGTVFAWTLLQKTCCHQFFELICCLFNLNVFTNVTEGKRNLAEPANIKTTYVAPELVLGQVTNSFAIWSDAVLRV